MPYRRLPKTDQARIRALQVVTSLERQFEVNELPAPSRLMTLAKTQLSLFENSVILYNQTYNMWIEENKKYQQKIQTVRMYISHFIQVYNMAVTRREFKKETKIFYGLDVESNSIPELNTENALLEWGEKLIAGERERTRNGGAPMNYPSIGKLQVHFDLFKDFKISQQVRQSSIMRFQEEVVAKRDDMDTLIKDIWDSIEDFYKELPPYSRLEACKNCGVIYYYRNGERELTPEDDINLFSDLQPE